MSDYADPVCMSLILSHSLALFPCPTVIVSSKTAERVPDWNIPLCFSFAVESTRELRAGHVISHASGVRASIFPLSRLTHISTHKYTHTKKGTLRHAHTKADSTCPFSFAWQITSLHILAMAYTFAPKSILTSWVHVYTCICVWVSLCLCGRKYSYSLDRLLGAYKYLFSSIQRPKQQSYCLSTWCKQRLRP